jgi:GTPase
MPLPIVAIVGRPNVGKSSLLNMLAGRRISIVDPTAGVTRDRIQAMCDFDGLYFDLVDTGGYGIVDRDDLGDEVEQQIRYAVEAAALILFVVDARSGVTPLDMAVTEWLRKSGRPVILLANKVDADNTPTELGEFHKLGFGAPLAVSAMHRRGETELKGLIAAAIKPLVDGVAPSEPVMKMAIVGRRNVGKSTFINALAGQERVIVSEVPGTTRDAIDVRFERDGHTFLAIDTAGVRKKGKFADDIEFYSFHRAELSIRRADVVLFLLDATADVSTVDKRLGSYITAQFKPCIIVVNKWDLAKERASTQDYGDYLQKMFHGLEYAPIAFMTAKDAKNVQSVVDLALNLFKQARQRVTTGQFNEVIAEIMEQPAPRPKHGAGPVKVFYGTQISTEPPTLVFFINDPRRVSPAFERFMMNRLRERLPFPEVPIRLMFRARGRSPKPTGA